MRIFFTCDVLCSGALLEPETSPGRERHSRRVRASGGANQASLSHARVVARNLPCAGRTLAAYKDARRRLKGLSDDKLMRILVVPQGDRLQAGSVYLELEDDNAEPFTACGDEIAGRDDLYIPKKDIDYVLWNRLTGVNNPERLDQASEGATPSP